MGYSVPIIAALYDLDVWLYLYTTSHWTSPVGQMMRQQICFCLHKTLQCRWLKKFYAANFSCHTLDNAVCKMGSFVWLVRYQRKWYWLPGFSFSYHCSQVYVMLLATTAYVVCLVGIILMYIWYTPEPSCLLNIFFITWTLVLLQLMTSVSLHPKVSSDHLSAFLFFHLPS